jgi:transcriptional regulator with XRE-family HTH domain
METKQNFKKLLGHNVRRVRIDKRLSVEKLAIESGLAYSQVSRIELGKISTSAYTLYVISKTLNVSPSAFFETPGININNEDHIKNNQM